MASRAVTARDLRSPHSAPLGVRVEQEQRLEVSSDAFSNHVLPFRAHLDTPKPTHIDIYNKLAYALNHSFIRSLKVYTQTLHSVHGRLGFRFISLSQGLTRTHDQSAINLNSPIHLLAFMKG